MDRQIDVSPRSREQFPSIIFNEGDGRIRGIPRHGYEIYMPGNDELMVLMEQAKKFTVIQEDRFVLLLMVHR